MGDNKTKPFTHKIVWTWDSWLCDPDSSSSFESEYADFIDFLAGLGYNSLVIWGFIDERHGGVASAQRVAAYGASRHVRVLPGVGAGGYHGFSMSRGLPYNLHDFLASHKHARAHPRDGSGPRDDLMCLRKPESQQWLKEGAEWLASSFDIGGVNIETNEMDGICVCPDCSVATSAEPDRLRYAASFGDLAVAVPLISESLWQSRPGALVTYATYQPAWCEREEDSHLLADIPGEAVAQWNMEMSRCGASGKPVQRNVSLIHSGGTSYHLTAFPPRWGFTQHRCFLPEIALAHQFAANQRQMQMDGFTLGNAGSHKMPDNEINYMAFAAFADDPALTPEEFLESRLPSLYGPGAAADVVLLMLEQPQVHRLVAPVWISLASMLFFADTSARPEQATDQALAGLAKQLALARKARGTATAGGAARLKLIETVLSEYLTICRISRDARLKGIYLRPVDQDAIRLVRKLGSEYGLSPKVYFTGAGDCA